MSDARSGIPSDLATDNHQAMLFRQIIMKRFLSFLLVSIGLAPCVALADGATDLYGALPSKIVDYENPMKLNLELMEDDAGQDPGQPTHEQKDYYKSTSAQQWAEHYHMKPGMRKLREGNLEGALREFAFVLRFVPNHPRALVLAGDVSIILRRSEEGDDYFKKAFELYPQTARASSYKDYGRFLYRSGKYKEAVENLNKSLQMDPKLSEAHYLIGLSYFELKDLQHANHHARIVYAGGFPLSDLRDKLIEANAWNTAGPSRSASPDPVKKSKDRHDSSRGTGVPAK